MIHDLGNEISKLLSKTGWEDTKVLYNFFNKRQKNEHIFYLDLKDGLDKVIPVV